jgi:ubiquinone/menaquinone biosynthesis C-methylase UbiE
VIRWTQARRWDRRAPSWDAAGSSGLGAVVDAVLRAADVQSGQRAVDLGCGTGQLALPMAAQGVEVTAVDISPTMIDHLLKKAARGGIDGVTGIVSAIEQLELPDESVDVVVSNYALHHLRDGDKQAVLHRAVRWLRPGGSIVIGDMMFGRGASPRDRAIICSKVATLAKRGPAGWWRIAKGAVRFTLRVQERPATMEVWRRFFDAAGLTDVTMLPVVAEAAVVSGVKPGRDSRRRLDSVSATNLAG